MSATTGYGITLLRPAKDPIFDKEEIVVAKGTIFFTITRGTAQATRRNNWTHGYFWLLWLWWFTGWLPLEDRVRFAFRTLLLASLPVWLPIYVAVRTFRRAERRLYKMVFPDDA